MWPHLTFSRNKNTSNKICTQWGQLPPLESLCSGGMSQVFLIYYIRCIMSIRFWLLQCKGGAMNCLRSQVQDFHAFYLHIVFKKNFLRGFKLTFSCYFLTIYTTRPVINYCYFLKPFNIYFIEVWHLQQSNSRSVTVPVQIRPNLKSYCNPTFLQ